jgi:hypothetical protein
MVAVSHLLDGFHFLLLKFSTPILSPMSLAQRHPFKTLINTKNISKNVQESQHQMTQHKRRNSSNKIKCVMDMMKLAASKYACTTTGS